MWCGGVWCGLISAGWGCGELRSVFGLSGVRVTTLPAQKSYHTNFFSSNIPHNDFLFSYFL